MSIAGKSMVNLGRFKEGFIMYHPRGKQYYYVRWRHEKWKEINLTNDEGRKIIGDAHHHYLSNHRQELLKLYPN